MMTMTKKSFGARVLPAVAVAASLLVAGCNDSSGPGTVDANGALRSLALGIADASGLGSPTSPDIEQAFADLAPVLGQVTVNIGGTARQMYAFGFHESFPQGTCMETLIVDPDFPPPEGECTSPELGLVLVLWQSHSARQAPDRILILVGDAGTSEFDFDANPDAINPAFALYVENQADLWSSLSGTLSSQIASLNQPCNTPLPPYAKTGSCSFATFDEEGQIVFEPFDLGGTSTERLTVTLPRQTIYGLLIAISEVQPITLSAAGNRVVEALLTQRLNRIAPRFSGVAPSLTRGR